MATVIYASASVLPFLDRFCPYTTPAHKMIAAMLALTVTHFKKAAVPAVFSLYRKINHPEWLESILKRIFNFLMPYGTIQQSPASDGEVPIDYITSQMLGWLVDNCEDSHSIDTTLQAIAGATCELPQEPLFASGAGKILLRRLDSYSQWDHTSGRYRLRDSAQLPLVMKYLRAYTLLVSGNTYSVLEDRWKPDRLNEPHFWLHFPGSLIPDICAM
jgi:hypothetical protein